MTHLLRCLITLLAVAGLASPSITPRLAQGRSSGFSRCQRARSTAQTDRSHSIAIRDTADRKVQTAKGSGQDETPAVVSTERIRWPEFTAVLELTSTPEPHPVRHYAQSTFGRAPPL